MGTPHSYDYSAGSARSLLLLLALMLWILAQPGYAEEHDAQSISPGNPDKVYVTVGIIDVDAISSAAQSFTVNVFVQFRWYDPALAHAGPGKLRRNLTEINAPRFLLVNRQRTWSTLLNVVDISPAGEAVYRMRLWGDFSQPLRLHDFPFDSHEFSIPIIALGFNGDPVALEPDPDAGSFIASTLSVADWRVSDWSGKADRIELVRGEVDRGYVFSFRAERIYNHHVIKFIVPLILIVMMSWVVFWIDPKESGSQLSVAVTAALTLIAYHIALASKLPDIPYLTRMDRFLFGSTLMVFSALLEVVITSRMAVHGRLRRARWVDLACRVLFPLGYVVIAGWALGIPDVIESVIPEAVSPAY